MTQNIDIFYIKKSCDMSHLVGKYTKYSIAIKTNQKLDIVNQ